MTERRLCQPDNDERSALVRKRDTRCVGFSMSFMRVRDGEAVDGDRDGVRRFLGDRGLTVETRHETSAHLLTAEGNQLSLDGSWTDLHVNPMDSPHEFSGGIWHANLSVEECEFIFDLCVAAGFLICNHQGSPMFVVPKNNHGVDDLQQLVDDPSIVFVESADEMRRALLGDFARFVTYRNQVITSNLP